MITRPKADPELGFNVYELDQRQASKITRLMQSEFENTIGPGGRRKQRAAQEVVDSSPRIPRKSLAIEDDSDEEH